MSKYCQNDKNNLTVPVTAMEPNISNEPMGKEEAQGLDPRVNIRVISYRKFNHDPDGVSAKACLDGIVRRGLLSDDSAKEIKKVSFESIICQQGEEEKTVIYIDTI